MSLYKYCENEIDDIFESTGLGRNIVEKYIELDKAENV